MTIILSALLAFAQLSVERQAPRAVVDCVPVTPGVSAASAGSDRPGLDADSGFTWNLQATLPSTVLIDLSFADDSVGYACAELGIVYKTTNLGATWSRIMNLGFPYYWYGVSAVSRQRAIVTGFNNTAGTGIYRWTTDGGSSWDSIVTLDTANWLSRAHFADSLHGIISAGWNGGIWRTDNGGLNPSDWSYVQIDPERGWFEGNFCYRADGRCYLTGISFCQSADHGVNWNVQHSADPVFDGGVWFSDTLHGWTGGGQISAPVSGWVHRTIDGGATWSDRLIETPAPVRAVLFLNDTLGFAVGGNVYSSAGFIYSTVNGGDSWRLDVNTGAEMKGIDYKVVGDSIDIWCSGFNNSGNFTGYIYKTRIAPFGTGIRESGVVNGWSGGRLLPTILTEASCIKHLASGVIFDAMGRRALNPKPGIYFVRSEPSAVGRAREAAAQPHESAVTKVIVTR
jgi:photosystem II stability/assembly factor-like uncharacterized protein